MIPTKRTEQQEQFIQLRAQGKSYNDISAELGISKGSCSNWAKRYAAEIERAAQNPQRPAENLPKPKPTKKKAPRVVDITHKLEFNNKPDDRPFNHYLTPDFRERYKRGDITEEERIDIETMQQAIKEIAEAFKSSHINDEINEMARATAEMLQKNIGESMRQIKLEFSTSGIKSAINSLLESYKPLAEQLGKYVEEQIAALPPEEQAKLRAELAEQKAAGSTGEQPQADSGTTTDIIAAAAAAKIQNIVFDRVFATVLSGAITNHLSTINTTIHKPEINKVTGKATVKLGNGFALHIENYDRTGREWKVSTIKLLHICTLLLTENNHYREKNPDAIKLTVAFSVSDYMQLRGIPNNKSSRKEARATLKKDLDTLGNSSIDWAEKTKGRRKSERSYLNTPILGGSYGIDRQGNVVVTFSKQFAEYLIQDAFLMQYALPLLKTDERNANTYPLGCKLTLHSSIDHNIKAGTDKIISVKKALEICPNIPTYEELIARNERHWERYIKESLEKALDSLTFAKWEYCNAKGQPLTDEQLADNRYSSFIGLYIHFDLIDAPDQTKRLKAKAERASKRKARNDTKRTAKTEGASRHKSGQAGKGKE